MNRRSKLAVLAAVVFAMSRLAPAAEPWGEPERLLRVEPGALRAWDNVEGRPYHCGGAPLSRSEGGERAVSLKPGEYVVFLVPAGEALRLSPVEPDRLDISAVSCGISLDGKLFLDTPASLHAESGAIICRPDAASPVAICVRHTGHSDGSVSFRPYISRLFQPDASIRFDRHLDLGLPEIRLNSVQDASTRRFGFLAAGTNVSGEVRGSGWLAVETHLLYGSDSSDRHRLYRLEAKLGRSQWLEYQTTVSPVLKVAGKWSEFVPGILRTSYIYAEDQTNELVIASSDNVAIRLRRANSNEFSRPLVQASQSFWDLSGHELQTVASPEDPRWVPFAMRLQRDRRFKDGGQLAAELLRKVDARLPYDPARRAAVSDMESRGTFFRTLLPKGESSGPSYKNAYYAVQRIVEPGQRTRVRQIPDQLEGDLLSLVGQSTFTPVGKEPVAFALSPGSSSGKIRLLVLHENGESEIGLVVMVDDAPPAVVKSVPCKVETRPPVMLDDFIESCLGDQEALKGTLSSRFAAGRYAAGFVQTHFVELQIPDGAERVLLSARRSQGAAPLYIAVQQQASSRVTCGQSEMVSRFRAAEKLQVIDERFLDLLSGGYPEAGVPAERDLVNDWVPVTRLLRSRAKIIDSSVTRDDQDIPDGSETSSDSLADLDVEAERLAAAGNLDSAAVVLAEIVSRDRLCKMPGVRVRLLDALSKTGERFLAIHLARGVLADAAESPAREQVYGWLMEYYRLTGDDLAIAAIQAYRTVVDPSAERFREVADRFIKDDKPYEALLIILALPATEWPLPTALNAAAALRWQGLYAFFLDRLGTESNRELYVGIQELLKGSKVQAKRMFEKAGSAGSAWLAALEEEENVLAGMTGLRPSDPLRTLALWAHLSPLYPEPLASRAEPECVVSSGGARLLYSKDNDTHSLVFLARPDMPVRAVIPGGVQVSVTARPLHAKGAWIPQTGSITVVDNIQTSSIPVFMNTPSRTDLEIIGDSEYQAGRAVPFKLDLKPGLHDIKVASKTMELLVQISVSRPLLPYTYLPGLNRDLAVALVGEQEFESALESSVVGSRVLSGDAPEVASVNRRALSLLTMSPEDARREAVQLASEVHARESVVDLGIAQSVLKLGGVWETLSTVHRNAGVRIVEQKGWSPESPGMSVRQALLRDIEPDEYVLYADGIRSLSLYCDKEVSAELIIKLCALPNSTVMPVDIECRLDGETLTSVTLDGSIRRVSLPVNITPGRHLLEVQAQGLAHFIAFKLVAGPNAEGDDWIDDAGVSKKAYHLASPRQPVEIRVPELSWLRVMKYTSRGPVWTWHLVSGPEETLELPCDSGSASTMYRISRFEWRLEPEDDASVQPDLPSTAVEPMSDLAALALPSADAFDIARDLPGKGHEDGTWSYQIQAVSRTDVDADGKGRNKGREKFVEAGVSHRLYISERRLRTHSELFARQHVDGDSVLGAEFGLIKSLSSASATVRFDGGWMLQNTEFNQEQGGSLRLSISQQRGDPMFFSHSPRIGLFARWLDDEWETPYPDGELDMDLFSAYKKDHKLGVSLSDYAEWSPRNDLSLFARIEAMSNESEFTLDYFDWRAGVRAWADPFVLSATYRQTRYAADEDRKNDSVRNLLMLEGQMHSWLSLANRSELGVRAVYDIDDKEASVWLTLSLHRSAGRGLRDFDPGAVDFLPVRKERYLDQ